MASSPSETEVEKGTPDVSADAAASPHMKAGPDSTQMPFWRLLVVIISVSVGLFLSFLDTSIVATSLFAIGQEFNNLEIVNWVALAYTLSYLSLASLLARISDIIGRRGAFTLSYVIFIAFSLGCGFAQSLEQLIVFRVLQGAGGSGLYSITMVILPEITPRKWHKHLGGLIGIVITIGSVLGPVLGGVFSQYATWRWIFLINGPIGGVSLVPFVLAWPSSKYLHANERRSWRELDYLGSFLLVAASVLVVFAFQNAGGAADQWSQAVFIAPLVLGIVSVISLTAWSILIDKRWGESVAAAIPVRLLRNRVYSSATLNTMFLGFPFILITYAYPLRLQVVNGQNALMSGVMLLPMLGSSAVGSFIAGLANGKKDRTFATLVISTSLTVIGCGLLSTLSGSTTTEYKALGFLVFVGLGFGTTVATTTILASMQSSIRDHATAQGIVAQVRVLGGSIGIAASSAILGTMLRSGFGESVESYQIDSLRSQDQVSAAQKAYSDAFNKDMQVCTIVAGLAILWALGTYRRNPPTVDERKQQQMEEEIARSRKLVNETQSI